MALHTLVAKKWIYLSAPERAPRIACPRLHGVPGTFTESVQRLKDTKAIPEASARDRAIPTASCMMSILATQRPLPKQGSAERPADTRNLVVPL